MAIVIGAASTAELTGADCVISANWSFSPNRQVLYCIGEFVPDEDRTYYKPTESLNLTVYSPGPLYSTEPSQTCENANQIAASVTPLACGTDVPDGVDGDWYVASYSFSKEDAALPGQESWSLTHWVTGGLTNVIEPDYILRGLAEGQATANAGIVFTGATAESTTGSVSANSFGRAETLTAGTVESVGGGTDTVGETGQGSASIPYTPLYIGS
jgi:hypothetical protein